MYRCWIPRCSKIFEVDLSSTPNSLSEKFHIVRKVWRQWNVPEVLPWCSSSPAFWQSAEADKSEALKRLTECHFPEVLLPTSSDLDQITSTVSRLCKERSPTWCKDCLSPLLEQTRSVRSTLLSNPAHAETSVNDVGFICAYQKTLLSDIYCCIRWEISVVIGHWSTYVYLLNVFTRETYRSLTIKY